MTTYIIEQPKKGRAQSHSPYPNAEERELISANGLQAEPDDFAEEPIIEEADDESWADNQEITK
jgi:hypothetical protein